ncbi:unnamed protein product [Laminaria digitata]
MWAEAWLALGSLCLVVAHAASFEAGGRAGWFPNVRLISRHSDEALAGYLSKIANEPFNHDHVGVTSLQEPATARTVPDGFRVNARRQLLGTGDKVYKRAVQGGLRELGVVNRLSWAHVVVEEPDSRRWKKGMGLLTVAKCYGLLWSANPCRLVHAHWDKTLPRTVGEGKYSSVGFSTVFGHLMEGEERFSVEFRDQDSTVWLDLFSVSRGHGILGRLSMPLIRPIQKAFFAEQCRQMLTLVKEEEEKG